MATQARVTSTDALDTFRASLIVFIAKARTCADDAGDEVRRTRSWLQNEQMLRWEGEIRRRAKALDQAQNELRNAQFAGGQQSAVQIRQAAVNRAKQTLAEAEDRVRRVKKWNQNYDNCADPVVKRLEGFNQFITFDLPKAVAHLRNVQKALEAYAETGASGSGPAVAPAAGEEAEPGTTEPPTEPPAT
jgi:hypothetical protein